MDLDVYKKFEKFTNSEIANYYVDMCAYSCPKYEFSVIEKIIIGRFLSEYFEGNVEV